MMLENRLSFMSVINAVLTAEYISLRKNSNALIKIVATVKHH